MPMRGRSSTANLRAALDATRVTDSFSNDTYNSGAKAAALSIFESTKQRFFCQLLIGMKLPSLVPAIRADLARGESVVIQLVSTSEAMLNRALAALTVEERANLDIELSPQRVPHVLSDGRLPGPADEDLRRRDRQDPLRTDVGRGRPPRLQPGGARDARQSPRAALRPADRRLRARSYHRAFRHRCGRRGDGAQPARHHGRARSPARRKPLAPHQPCRDRRLHARREEDPDLLRRWRHRPQLSCEPDVREPVAPQPLPPRAGLAR